MSEFWKSLPRKFCDICKCWFADNKASIDFHERGKRHQENAQKRIQDIQKRGIKDFKKQKQLEDDMAKIERAALAAYKKDLQNNNEAVSSNEEAVAAAMMSTPTTPQQPKSSKKSKNKADVKIKKEKVDVSAVKLETQVVKKWYEAMSEEGYKYYWHIETSETKWEPPDEDFVTIEEQQTLSNDSVKVNSEDNEDTKCINVKIKTDPDAPVSSVGPQPKIDPYGKWSEVEYSEPEHIDLQLPKISEDYVEVVIPVARDEPKLCVKEKVVGALADTDPNEKVVFKKTKIYWFLKEER